MISSIFLITNFTKKNKKKALFKKEGKHAYGLMHPYKRGRTNPTKIFSSHLAFKS